MGTQRETERKYAVNGAAAVPELDAVPSVDRVSPTQREDLEAVYFDTADLRLARWGLTLRRRGGGHDAGWHLKVPVGPDSRAEIQRPLGGQRPPEELVGLLEGITRGAELVAVARIGTDRQRVILLGDKGKVLAEVTDDRVTGQALRRAGPADRWREIEVELGEQGEPDFLDAVEERLLAAGLRRSADESKLLRVLRESPRRVTSGRKVDAGQALLAYLTEQTGNLMRQDVLVRQRADDAVHQLRVAARRIRSALRVYRKIVDADRTAAVRAELQWLTRRLGPARDLEVLEERFRAAVAELPDRLTIGPVHTRLTRYFAPAQQDAEQTVWRTLRSRRYRELLDALEELIERPPLTRRAARPARKELPKQVWRAYRTVARRLDRVGTRPSGAAHDTALHRTRKAAKRLRYAIEVAEPVLGGKARRTRKRAKAFTSVLGRFQDSVVALPALRRLGAASHAGGENGFTFGLLYAREQRAAEHAESELAARWKRLGKRTAWLS